MASVSLVYGIAFAHVTKTYEDGQLALDGFDLTIEPGELFSLVGPSGCGKTTVLRILSGLESPTAGQVWLGERNITTLETRERGLAMITQQNQLLNKRTAAGNIRFPLEVRDPRTWTHTPDELLEFEASHLNIKDLLDRKASTLSEGERRIVQLARCIIKSPSTLLMDEPFAYLEDQIRLRLRADIVRIHRDRGLTTIMATASQHDAMAMSDRIGVLIDGILHQVGTPSDVYDRPETADIPFATNVAMVPAPWNQDHLLLHVGIKGYEIQRTQRPRANLVLLLDVSGSMAGPGRLDLVKKSIHLMLGQLDDSDRVAIVTYAGRSGIALPPTPARDRSRIRSVLDNLHAGGSTAGASGLATAYELANKTSTPRRLIASFWPPMAISMSALAIPAHLND